MGRMLEKEIIMKKLNIVLVGLGFGGAFVPIYKDHPGVGSIGIFDTDSSVMEEFARAHGIERLYHSFEEILEDEEVDAVHLVTPTHAIAPMRAMAGSRICKVHCFGSGTMEEGMEEQYGNPYPVESAIFSFENGLKGEATRTLFETARVYQEGMFVYGSDASFEWGFSDGDNPIITTAVKAADGKRGGTTVVRETVMPNYYSMLPEEIRKHTVGGNYDPLNPQESLISGAAGGHHGSHPHLVHEFVSSILENRKAAIDEVLGANITAAGICAHLSAMQDGAEVVVPVFDEG